MKLKQEKGRHSSGQAQVQDEPKAPLPRQHQD
jgi:hypothetical protein